MNVFIAFGLGMAAMFLLLIAIWAMMPGETEQERATRQWYDAKRKMQLLAERQGRRRA